MNKDTAEAYVNLTELRSGQIVLKEVSEEFDKAMRQILENPSSDPYVAMRNIGNAQALHKLLKKFDLAKQVTESK